MEDLRPKGYNLYGKNKTCVQCSEKCKQYSQMKIIACPYFNVKAVRQKEKQGTH